ncbi:MAG: hypothetical protein IJ043_10475 [Clostridia bacterium]|nr:hypothetical protein [Clostridia bacterium]
MFFAENYQAPLDIIYALYFWPERDISNEALLAEMSGNILLHTATEYKIAIWPYGHKNYTLYSDYTDGLFKISQPQNEQ